MTQPRTSAQPPLTGPFCPPIRDSLWRPENGVHLFAEHECGSMGRRPYCHETAMMARCCKLHDIPTGIAVPTKAFTTICAAFVARAFPDQAEPLWAEARAALAAAQVQLARELAERLAEEAAIDGRTA